MQLLRDSLVFDTHFGPSCSLRIWHMDDDDSAACTNHPPGRDTTPPLKTHQNKANVVAATAWYLTQTWTLMF